MRKFIITHPGHNGEATVTYDCEDRLCEMNLVNTNMSVEERFYFKQKVACHVNNIASKFDGQTTIIEAEYEVTLEEFVREYPNKRNTHLLPDIWKKMTKTDQLKAWMGAKEYRRYCERNGEWYKPKIAAAWLKNKEYLNEWRKL